MYYLYFHIYCMFKTILSLVGLQISDDDLKNLCLIKFERLLSMNGKSLDNIESMPQPSNSEMD